MNKQNHTFDLGKDRIGKLLARFAFPSIASLVFSSLYTIADQLFIGNSSIGVLGTSSIGIVFPLLVICLAFSYWLGDGCAAYLSLCQGRKDSQTPGKAIATSLSFGLLISLALIIIFFFFAEPLLTVFGATEATLASAKEYLYILLFFVPALVLGTMTSPIIRSDGSPFYALITIAIASVINIALDPIFIYLLNWGIAGAAWATGIAFVFAYLLSMLYFIKPKNFEITPKDFIPHLNYFVTILRYGISSFITQMSIVSISLACDLVVRHYGPLSKYGIDIPIAAMAIESKVFTIVANIVVGIASGSQPIVGYNLGSKNIKRVKQTFFLALIWTVGISAFFTLICEIFPKQVMALFGQSDDPLYWEYGITLLRIFLASIVLANYMKLACIFFQACGKSIPASIISASRDIIGFLPFLLLLPYISESLSQGSGITTLLYACLIADIVGFTSSVIYTIILFKKLNAIEKETSLDSVKFENAIES